MTQPSGTVPPCLIFIDKEGRWYHQGAEMIHREFVRAFYQNIELDPDGRYRITWNGTECTVDVEDTAFVVRGTSVERGCDHRPLEVQIHLSDDTDEPLDPETLYAGEDHVLYCRVKSGAFPARFTRPAYYQLAELIEEDDHGYFLPISGKRYHLPSRPA